MINGEEVRVRREDRNSAKRRQPEKQGNRLTHRVEGKKKTHKSLLGSYFAEWYTSGRVVVAFKRPRAGHMEEG